MITVILYFNVMFCLFVYIDPDMYINIVIRRMLVHDKCTYEIRTLLGIRSILHGPKVNTCFCLHK